MNLQKLNIHEFHHVEPCIHHQVTFVLMIRFESISYFFPILSCTDTTKIVRTNIAWSWLCRFLFFRIYLFFKGYRCILCYRYILIQYFMYSSFCPNIAYKSFNIYVVYFSTDTPSPSPSPSPWDQSPIYRLSPSPPRWSPSPDLLQHWW